MPEMASASELIRRSTAGDRQALEDLFLLATQARESGQFQEAATLFREAAICFRISTFRERSHKEAAESSALSLSTTLTLIDRMLVLTDAIPPLSVKRKDIDREEIRKLVVEDPAFWKATDGVMSFLEDRLSKLGIHFFSPGGSVERKLTSFLCTLYSGDRRGREEELWQTDPVVRLAVHSVCAVLEKMWNSPRTDE
jgi:hypothetical protein